MSTTLGSAFTPQPTIEPDPDEIADLALLAAVQDLTEKVAGLQFPAPVVNVPAPRVRVDVPPLPAAPTAAEIGVAVANALPADDDTALLLAVTGVKDAVDNLAKKTTAPRFGTAGGLGGASFDSAGNLKVVTSGGSSGGLTDTQLRATPVPVSGTVSVSNFPATQPVSIASTVPVSGTFFQATQPVSLATNTPDVTDRAARLLGHVTVDNGSLGVTGTFFQATQPVSIAATVTTADSRLPSALNADGGLPTHVQNFPATQAVSAASLPLPAGAAQDGTDISAPTAMPAGGAGIRGWLSAIWTKLNGSLAVTGTFWQATQPVSLATNTPDVTDRAARLLGHVTVDNASIPVTGTFWQATQPVSLATNTPTLAAGTNTVGNLNEIRAATTYATIVSSAISLGATLTLPAAGAGLFHYITSIEITNYTGIARTGGATPVTVTTTNITGSPAYTFGTAAAIGTTDIQRPILATPLKTAVANTATTIVAPVVTGSFWRINVSYFVAP